MVAERKETVFDLEDIPGGDVLAEALDRHPEGMVLQRGGRAIGRIRTTDDGNGEEGTDQDRLGVASGKGNGRRGDADPDPAPDDWIVGPVKQMRPTGLTPELTARLDAIPILSAEDVERIRDQPMSPERRARLMELSGPPNPDRAERMHRIVEENRQASIRRQMAEIEREREREGS